MNHTHFEAVQMIHHFSASITEEDLAAVEVSIHPPFTDLRSVQTVLESEKISVVLGAQHCYFEPKGAFTGEISPNMLAKLHVGYVIVGHSERRLILGQSDEVVAKTLRAVLAAGMSPILCVGESKDVRDSGGAQSHVMAQLRSALQGLSPALVQRCVVAYEPIWAIGTGVNASTMDAQEMCQVIREEIETIVGPGVGSGVRILYGGSVTPDNARSLCRQKDVDGLLVGGASLDGDSFAKVVKAAGR